MTGEPVKLYIYDLSNGLAKQMSMSLTGRQIGTTSMRMTWVYKVITNTSLLDGIWHTSVVVFGQEFYYGQGILTSPPGKRIGFIWMTFINMFVVKALRIMANHLKSLIWARPTCLQRWYWNTLKVNAVCLRKFISFIGWRIHYINVFWWQSWEIPLARLQLQHLFWKHVSVSDGKKHPKSYYKFAFRVLEHVSIKDTRNLGFVWYPFLVLLVNPCFLWSRICLVNLKQHLQQLLLSLLQHNHPRMHNPFYKISHQQLYQHHLNLFKQLKVLPV